LDEGHGFSRATIFQSYEGFRVCVRTNRLQNQSSPNPGRSPGLCPGLSSATLVQIRLGSTGRVDLPTTVFGSGRVPHVRPSVHGPKTDFSNALTPCTGILALGRSLFAFVAIALEGAAPWAAPRLFRPMYAGANMGHPSRKEGFVLCSNRSAADELHLGCDHNLISHLRDAGSVPATKSIQERLPIH
jgi:hypothetical protein